MLLLINSLQAPPPDDPGAEPKAHPFQVIWHAHLEAVTRLAFSCGADLGSFVGWLEAIGFFLVGVLAASLHSDAQAPLQALVGIMLTSQAELAAKVQLLAEAAPHGAGPAAAVRGHLAAWVLQVSDKGEVLLRGVVTLR